MTSISDKKALIIFAKFPLEGKVKTRLAESTGNGFALSAYKLFAEHVFNAAENLPDTNVYLYFDYSDIRGDVEKWVGRKFAFIRQSDGDLGTKMRTAFQNVFDSGVSKAVIIGSDLPDISAELLNSAFNSLSDVSAVISPSPDGGYGLLGLRRQTPNLFEGIEWSGEEVFTRTIEKIKANGQSYFILDELIDIDDEQDLEDWLKNGKNSELKTKIKKLYKYEI